MPMEIMKLTIASLSCFCGCPFKISQNVKGITQKDLKITVMHPVTTCDWGLSPEKSGTGRTREL